MSDTLYALGAQYDIRHHYSDDRPCVIQFNLCFKLYRFQLYELLNNISPNTSTDKQDVAKSAVLFKKGQLE